MSTFGFSDAVPSSLAVTFADPATGTNAQYWGPLLYAFSTPTGPLVLALSGVAGSSAIGSPPAQNPTGSLELRGVVGETAVAWADAAGHNAVAGIGSLGDVAAETAGTGDATADLSGEAATSAIGTSAATIDREIVGVVGSTDLGGLAPQDTEAVSGESATGAAGSAGVALGSSALGEASSAVLGDLTAAVAFALSGESATGVVTPPTADESVDAIGEALVGSVNGPTVELARDATGESLTGTPGDLTASIGTSATLTGEASTGAITAPTTAVDIAVAGESVTGDVGTVEALIGAVVALTGEAVSAAVGQPAAESTVALVGLDSGATVGTLTVGGAITRDTVSWGPLLPPRRRRPRRVPVPTPPAPTPAPAPMVVVALRGVAALSANTGTVTLTADVAVAGHSVTVDLGRVGVLIEHASVQSVAASASVGRLTATWQPIPEPEDVVVAMAPAVARAAYIDQAWIALQRQRRDLVEDDELCLLLGVFDDQA